MTIAPYRMLKAAEEREVKRQMNISWKILTPLELHPSDGNYYFKGYIQNDGDGLEDTYVRLINLQGSPVSVQSRKLHRKGGLVGHINIPNGEKLEFDLATVSGRKETGLNIEGYEGDEKMDQKVNGPAITPGEYTLTLRFFAKDKDKRDHSFKIKVKEGGGVDCVEILEGQNST